MVKEIRTIIFISSLAISRLDTVWRSDAEMSGYIGTYGLASLLLWHKSKGTSRHLKRNATWRCWASLTVGTKQWLCQAPDILCLCNGFETLLLLNFPSFQYHYLGQETHSIRRENTSLEVWELMSWVEVLEEWLSHLVPLWKHYGSMQLYKKKNCSWQIILLELVSLSCGYEQES